MAAPQEAKRFVRCPFAIHAPAWPHRGPERARARPKKPPKEKEEAQQAPPAVPGPFRLPARFTPAHVSRVATWPAPAPATLNPFHPFPTFHTFPPAAARRGAPGEISGISPGTTGAGGRRAVLAVLAKHGAGDTAAPPPPTPEGRGRRPAAISNNVSAPRGGGAGSPRG